MNNSKRIVLLSLLSLIVVVALVAINRRRGPDEPGASSAQPTAPTTSVQRPGLEGDPSALGTQQPQTVSGMKPHETQSGKVPSGAYDYGEPVAHAGQMVVASVKVGEESYKLTPNQVGGFQRVMVSPKQVIPVVVSYPEAKPGQQVVIQAMDGGTCVEPGRPPGIDHDLVRMVRLDEKKRANFAVQVSEDAGTHRYVLMRGADQKVLDFWVGPQEVAAK